MEHLCPLHKIKPYHPFFVFYGETFTPTLWFSCRPDPQQHHYCCSLPNEECTNTSYHISTAPIPRSAPESGYIAAQDPTVA